MAYSCIHGSHRFSWDMGQSASVLGAPPTKDHTPSSESEYDTARAPGKESVDCLFGGLHITDWDSSQNLCLGPR